MWRGSADWIDGPLAPGGTEMTVTIIKRCECDLCGKTEDDPKEGPYEVRDPRDPDIEIECCDECLHDYDQSMSAAFAAFMLRRKRYDCPPGRG